MNATLKLPPRIAQEHYSEKLRDEVMPLLQKNWKESASYLQEVVLSPNFERYKDMDAKGQLLCVTARSHSGRLVGYGVWYIVTSFTWEGKSGNGVALYIEEGYRGHGMNILRQGERLLDAQGIKRKYWFAKPDSVLYKLLVAIGYTPDEVVMEKVDGMSRN
jgi:hypothetical protein